MKIFPRLSFIFIILISIGINNNYAQTLCFDAIETRGCAPFTIHIQECVVGVPVSSLLYDYDYDPNGSLNLTSDTFHTYSTPGIYSILQLGNVGPSGDTLLKINYIEVLPSPIPQFEAFLCDSNRVVISILDNNYEEYIIDWGNGVIETILGLSQKSLKYTTGGSKNISIQGNYVPGSCGATTNFSISTLNLIPKPILTDFTFISNQTDSVNFNFNTTSSVTYDLEVSDNALSNFQNVLNFKSDGSSINYIDSSAGSYCYRVQAEDACGNQKVSEPICTIKLEGQALNNKNQINWKPYPLPGNVIEWEYSKDGNLLENISPTFSEIFRIDSPVVCNTRYCYQLNAKLFGGVNSVSNELCLVGLSIDTPGVIQRFNVSIEQNQTQLNWQEDSLADIYNMKRGFSKASIFDSTRNTSYSLAAPLQDLPRVCYAMDFLDECKNRSISTQIHCPVEITVELNANEDRLVQWIGYKGWPFGADSYTLEKLDLNNEVYYSEKLDNTSFSFVDRGIDTVLQKLRYRIKAVSKDSIPLTSYSLVYEIEQVFKMYFPTAFSPNSDGLNDIFKPIGAFADNYTMQIYNRWGELIFASKNYRKGWDGTINERDAPEGVYVYKVDAEDELGRPFSTKSTITLTR